MNSLLFSSNKMFAVMAVDSQLLMYITCLDLSSWPNFTDYIDPYVTYMTKNKILSTPVYVKKN